MPKRKGTTETIVGLFVIASLLLLLAVVVLIGRQQQFFEDHVDMTGVFESVGGLQSGAEVHLAGINVGHVKDIQFGPTNKVEVTISVSKKQMIRIRGDSVASIQTMGLMGDRYVEITVGTENEPSIPYGGTIKTSELVELTELLESARPTLQNVENAMENISLITDELADPEGEVRKIINNITVMTTDINEGRGTIGALLKRDDIYQKGSEILDTTQETIENFEEVSDNMKEASVELPEIMAKVGQSAEKFGEFSDSAAQAASDFEDILDSGKEAMKEAEIFASNLKEASQDIKEATPHFGPLIISVDEGVDEAKKVIEAAKHSWLIRGYFEPVSPGEPIVLSGRDVAPVEVSQ